MASTKTFAEMKKPVRRPTPDEIAAFEETGKAASARDPALLATETRKPVSTEPQKHADAEASITGNKETPEHGSPPSRIPEKADSQNATITETNKPANTETQISVPIARLTIDLPEPAHTRFKTACVMTKRKMAEEVRAFIEQRTAELERESGRAL